MAKTKEQKRDIIESLKKKIKQSKSIVFAKFDQLGVKDNEELRQKLKASKSEYCVTKKTLLDLAFKDESIDGLKPRDFEGRLATIFGYEDEVAPAKITGEFSKEHEDKIEFLGGILENKYMTADAVTALAKLPSKQELYAKIVGSINAPVSGFVNVLAGNLRKLVYVLNAVKDQKEA